MKKIITTQIQIIPTYTHSDDNMKKIITTQIQIIPTYTHSDDNIRLYISTAIKRTQSNKTKDYINPLEKLEQLHELEKVDAPEITLVQTLTKKIVSFTKEEALILCFFKNFTPTQLNNTLVEYYNSDHHPHFTKNNLEFKGKNADTMKKLWYSARTLFHTLKMDNSGLTLAELNNVSPKKLISTIAYTAKPMITLVLLINTMKEIFSSNDFLENNKITSENCNAILASLGRTVNPGAEFKFAVLLMKLIPDYTKELLSIKNDQVNPGHLRLEVIEKNGPGVLQGDSFVELYKELDFYKERDSKSQDKATYQMKYPSVNLYRLIPILEEQVRKLNPNKYEIESNLTFNQKDHDSQNETIKETQQQITQAVSQKIPIEFQKQLDSLKDEFQQKYDALEKRYCELEEKYDVIGKQYCELEGKYDIEKDQASKKQDINNKHQKTSIHILEASNKPSAQKKEDIDYPEEFIKLLTTYTSMRKRDDKNMEKVKSKEMAEMCAPEDLTFTNVDQNLHTHPNDDKVVLEGEDSLFFNKG